MMLPIVGSIRNTVKLAEMESKWQQKKADGSKAFKREMTPQERQIQQFKEDLQKMRENDQMAAIDAKLNAGELLTPEELSYLQRNCPEKYQEYLEIKGEREAYKRQVRSCKTKEDVERLKMAKMNGFLAEAKSVMHNPNIPMGKKKALMEKLLRKTMGIEKEHIKFVQSAGYKDLPTDAELAKEAKEKAERGKEQTEENPVPEDILQKAPEPDGEAQKPEETDIKSLESKGEDAVPAAEKHAPYTLPELKKAADAVFLELRDMVKKQK